MSPIKKFARNKSLLCHLNIYSRSQDVGVVISAGTSDRDLGRLGAAEENIRPAVVRIRFAAPVASTRKYEEHFCVICFDCQDLLRLVPTVVMLCHGRPEVIGTHNKGTIACKKICHSFSF